MSHQKPEFFDKDRLYQLALSRWVNEGGAVPPVIPGTDKDQNSAPKKTNADPDTLRSRVR